jgi:GNAT superfamily N-acetyltransferase
MKPPALRFRPAQPGDVPAIVELVNSAYRGDSSRAGWTTEADLLDGQRTDAEEVAALITAPRSMILLCFQGEVLIGSTHLAAEEEGAYLGMFTVRPGRQGEGIGKRFLAAAESAVREQFGAGRLRMTVISLRDELIAFYERRGYRRTGGFEAFPTDIRYGIPKVQGLRLAVLEKALPPG